jgi:GTPase SAR1 family protein
MKTMKISEYARIYHPKYSILRIIPDTSIRNYDSEQIARVICNMYSLPIDRMHFKKFQFTYKLPNKTAFFIDISTKDVSFYIITPEEYEKLIIEKCSCTWPKATIQKTGAFPMYSDKCLKYELMYRKEDALSLKVDRKSNEPLNSILNVIDILEQDDRVGIFYNFMPGNQLNWRNKHRDTLEKIKKNLPIDKQKLSISYILMYLIDEFMKLFIMVFDEVANFVGEGRNITAQQKHISAPGMNAYSLLSNTTARKADRNILDTQILVLSESQNEKRARNNAMAICESYKTISEDNSLIYKQFKCKFDYESFKIKGATVNTISTEEAANFIQVPGRYLLTQFQNIEQVNVLENSIPEELLKGYIYTGDATYKGHEYPTYLPDEYNLGNLPLTIAGPPGSGKTTYIANYIKYARDRKEPVILIDFIKNCELSDDIEKIVPKQDLIVLDCSKEENLQGMGYNEIDNRGKGKFEILKSANLMSEQTLALIDSINNEGLPLTSKMRRYLSAACNVAYISDISIKSPIQCLQDFRKRKQYIDAVPAEVRELLEDEINALYELDEYTLNKDPETKEVVSDLTGTKDSKIDGIMDRINLLKENIYLKYMYGMPCDKNINFVTAMEQGKVILIKMPEDVFNGKMVKNALATYFCSKIVLSTKLRGSIHKQPGRSHVIIDELYQVPTAARLIKDTLNQVRKFGQKYIFSCHYLNQIGILKEELKSGNSSYMLLHGSDKTIYKELEDELKPYEVEDLLNLKRFHSLNLIKYQKGYAKFITRLPAPIG